MQNESANVLVVGGGIGGLTAAIALQRKGFSVQVLEQTSEYLPLGAGITLQLNAMQALRHIGVSEAALAAGNPLDRLLIRRSDGRLVAEEDIRPLSAEFGVAFLATHRADLQQVLFDQVRPATVHNGFRVVECAEAGDTVIAVAADGRRIGGHALIGADGLRSQVRSHLWEDGPPRYSGSTSWRAVTKNCGRVPLETGGESWGQKSVFGLIPLPDDKLYWFATQRADAGGQDQGDPRESLLRIFGDWHEPIKSVVEQTDPSQIIRTDIRDRPPRFPWGRGRLTLLGDAAHPMTPNLGQGGCQAIEDAVVLAECLGRVESIEQGLRAYDLRRRPRTRQVVQTSRRVSELSHGRTPLYRFARRFVFPNIPRAIRSRLTRKLFEFDVRSGQID